MLQGKFHAAACQLMVAVPRSPEHALSATAAGCEVPDARGHSGTSPSREKKPSMRSKEPSDRWTLSPSG
jgi:hypothetical protein